MSFIESAEIPKVVIVGHVDHGKSSLIGRLIYDLDEVLMFTSQRNKLISFSHAKQKKMTEKHKQYH